MQNSWLMTPKNGIGEETCLGGTIQITGNQLHGGIWEYSSHKRIPHQLIHISEVEEARKWTVPSKEDETEFPREQDKVGQSWKTDLNNALANKEQLGEGSLQ